jgi:hypothetical protein
VTKYRLRKRNNERALTNPARADKQKTTRKPVPRRGKLKTPNDFIVT